MTTGIVPIRGWVLVDPPAVEPLTIAEVKLQLRISQTVEDALIDRQIQAAREFVEAFTHRALIVQTWTVRFDAFPPDGSPILVPRPPLVAVEAITYLDPAGIVRTWDAAAYEVTGASDVRALPPAPVDPHAQMGTVWPVAGGTYPATAVRAGAVRVTFTCGYGESPQQVPAMLTRAMQIKITDLFGLGRESRSPRDVAYDEGAIQNLLGPFVVFAPWATASRQATG